MFKRSSFGLLSNLVEMSASRERFRRWMFTAFCEEMVTPPDQWAHFRFAAFQKECCPKTSRKHIQGYVCFDRPVTLSFLKRIPGCDAYHWESCKGTHEQCLAYCTKEETREVGASPVILGVPPSPGTRTDLIDVCRAITEGQSMHDVALSYPTEMVKYSKGLMNYKLMVSPKRMWKTEVHVYYGPTGCGKTKLCWKVAPDAYDVPLSSGSNVMWFDCYDGQEDVILDEFYGNRCKFNFLLSLLDRYPCKVPCKGSHFQFVAKRLFLTSNTPPWLWYKPTKNRSWEALERRIDFCYEFTADDTYTVLKEPGSAVNRLQVLWSKHVWKSTSDQVFVRQPVGSAVAACAVCGDKKYRKRDGSCGVCAKRAECDISV